MRKKLINWLIMLMAITIGSVVTINSVLAEEAGAGGLLPYMVEPVLPDNQQTKNVGYFDLLVNPGEKQSFNIKISNLSDRQIKVKAIPYTARTANSGMVDYANDELPLTDNIPVLFSDIVSKKQTITLDKHEEKTITFDMTLPKEEFKGVIIGSFYFEEIKSEKEQKADTQKQGNIVIKNIFSTYISAIVRESKEPTKESFELGKVGIANTGGTFSLVTNIENQAPKLFSDYSLKGTIINKKGEKVGEIKNDSFAMAPNSSFDFSSKVDPNKFVSGKYELKMRIYNKDKSEHWDLTKSFKVTRKERKAIIEETYGEVKAEWNPLLVAGLVAIILILILVLIMTIKKKKA